LSHALPLAVRIWMRRLSSHLNLKAGGRWIFLGTGLGIFIGLAAGIFQIGLDIAYQILFYQPEEAFGVNTAGVGTIRFGRILFLLLIPAAGAAVSAFITSRWAPEATGHGTDGVVRAYHRSGGRVRPRVAPLKLLGSMFTLGTGGSAGREGPVAQFGASLGSTIGGLMGTDARTRRILLLSGAAGGIGAIFRAPLGGALFAAEVIYRGPDFEGPAVFPGAITSIVAYSTFVAMRGQEPLFHIPPLTFGKPSELLFYLLLGLICAVVGIFYVRVFYGGESLFHRLIANPPLRAAAAGVGLGAMTVLLGFFAGKDTLLLGGGYGPAQDAIDGKYGALLLLALALGKIFATTCTISGGGSGGVFAPSLAIGACLGGAFGQIALSLFPGSAPPTAACALVGMAGFFAGVAKTPLTAVILISEMTGSYGLLIPLMLVSSIACLLSPKSSIYREQVPARIHSPAHLGELASSALANMRVADAIDLRSEVPKADPATPAEDLVKRAMREDLDSFVVVDGSEQPLGLVAVSDIHRALRDPAGGKRTAGDLARRLVPRLTPDADLREALRLLVAHQEDDLLVVDPRDRGRAVAILSRQSLLAAYQKHIREVAG